MLTCARDRAGMVLHQEGVSFTFLCDMAVLPKRPATSPCGLLTLPVRYCLPADNKTGVCRGGCALSPARAAPGTPSVKTLKYDI